MRTGKHRWRLLLGSGLIGAIASLALWKSWPREPLLKQHVHKVCSGNFSEWPLWLWLSDHEVLICRSGQDEPGKFVRFDTATGREQPLPGLNRTLRLARHTQAESSPDGKWLLWGGGEADDSITAISLDGSQQHRWRGTYYRSSMSWMADSRHWGYFTDQKYNDAGSGRTKMIIHDVENPHRDTIVPLHVSDHILDPFFFKSDHLYECDASEENAEVTEWQMQPAVKRLRQLTVHPPLQPGETRTKVSMTERYEGVAISHHGDRLVWLLESNRNPSPLAGFIHRIWPQVPTDPASIQSIWITDIDGSHPHELGYQILKERNAAGMPGETADVIPIWEIRWLPGDKQISITTDDDLYTIPAD